MPPKKDAVPSSIEDLGKMIANLQLSITSQLSTITNRLDSLEGLHTRFDELEEKFVELSNENLSMKEAIKERDSTITKLHTTISNMESSINRMDQYNRSWSVRVFNIPLKDNEENNPQLVKTRVFNVFLPILEGAVKDGLLHSVPAPDLLLEVAHVLPGKTGQHKPIICRFLNRDMRTLCFRLKKKYAAREPPASNNRGTVTTEGRIINPFFEDLSKLNYSLMRDLISDSRVQASWSVSGSIRYRLVNSDQVKKVPSNATCVDDILK